jgi:hypothetical protein
MSHPVLVRLYLDQYAGLEDVDDQAVVVTDVPSYAAARRTIEEVKAGERRAPLTIVVRSRHFFAGFHDLGLLGDLAQIVCIAPRDEIARALHIQIPSDLADHDLIILGIRSHTDLLAAFGPEGIRDLASFDDALLVKAFGNQVFQIGDVSDFESWFEDLVAFLYPEETAAKAGWTVEYVRRLVEDRTRAILEQFGRGDLLPFVTDLLQRSAAGESRTYLNQLAVRHWLGNYPKLARKAVIDNMTEQVGKWQEAKGEAIILNALAPWCEALYGQAGNTLIERLEEVLTLLLAEGCLIEEEDLSQYIRQTSGRFTAEYDAAQARLGKWLLEQYSVGAARERRTMLSASLAQLDSHFAPLFRRIDRPARRASWIDSLLEFSDVISHLDEATPSRWADWLATYELLIKARHLNREVQDVVPGPYAGQSANLSTLFSTLDERLNSAFADWLLEQYPRLVASAIDQPLLVMNAARLALDSMAKGSRVILLAFDALDWELWRHLRSVLGRHGFVVQGHEAGLAVLPTITEFSRRAIFGGLSPRNLAHFVDDIYGTDISPWEEARTLARALGYLGRVDQLKGLPTNKRIQYLEGELVYVNGGETDFRQALRLDARCYALVYTEIDSHIHDSKLVESELKKTVRHWLEHLVEEIFKGIRQNPALRDETNLKIIVASDHGFLDVSEQSQAELERSLRAFLDLERHGRLAIVRVKREEGLESMVPVLQAVKDFYNKHSAAWHVIWREQSEQFGLAESSPSEGEVVAWLMPRLFQYVSKGKGNYVHGGLSMYETIVPIAVLARGELEIEAPVVILTGRLVSEEEGVLSIAILNKNDRPLQDLVIEIPELGLRGLRARDIGPGDVERLDVSVIPPASGDVPVQVVLDGEIGGMRKRFEEMRVLTVQPGRRERMRLSTRRTFEDEDW